MEQNLKDISALVTGGAVRIGREICRAFARRGARVAVHCNHSAAEGQALIEELPPHPDGHVLIAGDLTVPDFRDRLLSSLATAHDMRLNCLVNNASTYRRMLLRDAGAPALRQDFEINFFAPLLLMLDFARECGHGSVINLLDQRVNSVEKGAGGYGLAKKSLRDATETAALEWAPEMRVNAVAPGYSLPPPGVDKAKMIPLLPNVPMGGACSPREIAEACIFLVSSPSVTGQTLFLDGGMHLTSPTRPEKEASSHVPPVEEKL